MKAFNLNEYQLSNTDAKIKAFIQYLYYYYGSADENGGFDNMYFSLFNDDDLVESMKYYITVNKVQSQIAASNYFTYVEKFFQMLSNEYGIKNEYFIDRHRYEELRAKSNEVISKLKKSESKDVLSDEDFEVLNNGINEFFRLNIISDIYQEIDRIHNAGVKYSKIYNRFVSIVAVKLIMKFALGNLTTVSLNIGDIDIDSHTLYVNSFALNLDYDLTKLLSTYLGIRKYILEKYSIEESKLFIKHNGQTFIKGSTADYASFFIILTDTIQTASAETVSARRLCEMIDKGIDILTVSKITDRSTQACIKLQNNINDEEDIAKKLEEFFNNDNCNDIKVKFKRRGYLKCPYCNNEVEAISDEWVLVQFEEEGKKHLACRKCRGKNGKHNL